MKLEPILSLFTCAKTLLELLVYDLTNVKEVCLFFFVSKRWQYNEFYVRVCVSKFLNLYTVLLGPGILGGVA